MHPTLQYVERVEELLQRESTDTPYDFQNLFQADGYWARRIAQVRLHLLKQIDEPLRALLGPTERVLFITWGALYSPWESYFFGLERFLNHWAVVVTNSRLVLLQIDLAGRPGELRSHILLRAIETVEHTVLGKTRIHLYSGKRYTANIRSRDRKVLVATVRNARASAVGETTAEGIEHLCPYCYVRVDGHPLQCPECGGSFKSAKKAGLLSLMFPGLGDIYIGHWRFGILEIIVAVLIWIVVLLPDPQTPLTAVEHLLAGLFVIAFVHGIDAISTWHVARKGHYPAHGVSEPRPVNAA